MLVVPPGPFWSSRLAEPGEECGVRLFEWKRMAGSPVSGDREKVIWGGAGNLPGKGTFIFPQLSREAASCFHGRETGKGTTPFCVLLEVGD